MRCMLVLLLLSLLVLDATVVGAVPVGVVVYVKVLGTATDVRAEVVEQAAPGGEAKVLIAPQALPPAFTGRIARAQPSADGVYLLLTESRGVEIRNNKTGTTRTVFGNSYGLNPLEETVARQFGGGYWLWKRATGAVQRFPLAADESISALIWSPRGHRLLLRSDNTKTQLNTLRIYDPATGKARKIASIADINLATWTPDGKAVLMVQQASGKPARIVLAPLTGAPRTLFTWPRQVTALEMSPDGQRLALADSSGFTLLDRRGHTLQTLKSVPVGREEALSELRFSPDGATLALFTAQTTGEPHIFQHEALWKVEVATGHAQQLEQWDDTLGSEAGATTTRMLLGWSPTTPALLISGRSSTISGPDTEWRKLWSQPLTPDHPPTLLFDSGLFGTDLGWWVRE